MIKPDDVPVEVWAISAAIANEHLPVWAGRKGYLAETISRALLSAKEEARKEERERAASVGYRVCAETRHASLGDKVAAAIHNGDASRPGQRISRRMFGKRPPA